MAIQAGQAYIQVVPSLRGWQADVRKQLQRELSGVKGKVPIEPDLDGVKAEAQRKGNEAGGEFAQQFRRRVEAALKALPDAKIDADSTPAQREIAKIRRELETLSEKTVGIDLDAGEANAQIHRLKARLDQLAAESPTVDVEVDTAAASAHLAAIDRQVSRVDGRRANVEVDVDRDGNAQRASFFLTQQVNGLILAGAGIAPVFVPAFAAAAAGAVGFAASLAGATAGIGALAAAALPALSAVSDAVKATDQAEKAAASSAVNTTRQRVAAAYQAQQAARRVAKAQEDADRAAVEGARRVQDAQRQLADTRRDVAERIVEAQRRVEDSERALVRSHENVRRAQEALTYARREAARVLEDLREQSSDLALSEEAAEIGLLRARERLAEVQRDSRASALDRREAALAVAQAEDRLSDVQRDRRRTQTDLNDAEKRGVAGSRQVIDAQDRVSQAVESLAEARRDNVKAQQDLARAESDGARAIADAERRVADAREEAARRTADAAEAVADALAAQAQQAEMAALQAESGAAASRNLANALGELTPLQRQLYDGFLDLRDAFRQWSEALEPAVLPLFLDGIGLIRKTLPLLTPLVLAAADAFDVLIDRASAALDSPFWQRFFDFLSKTARDSIEAFGLALGDFARGLAGMLMAFGEFSGDINDGLVELADRFGDWGESLADNPGFHRFVDFVRTVWPPLKDTIKAVAEAFAAVAEALAPLGGGPVLTVIRTIAEWVADMDPSTLQAIAVAFGGIALAIKAIGIAMAVASIGPWGLAIIAIAGAVAFAYFKFEGFRDLVHDFIDWVKEEVIPRLEAFGKAIARVFEEEVRPRLEDFWDWFQREMVPVLQDIGDALVEGFRRVGEWLERNWPTIQDFIEGFVKFLKWAWDAVIFPVLSAFYKYLSEDLGPKLQWFWHNIAEPVFKAVAAVVEWAWKYIIGPALGALAWFIENILVPVIVWLWENVGPTWNLIATAIQFAWRYVIQPVFAAIDWFIRNVLWPVISWFWHDVIEPAWEGIQFAIALAWYFIRDKIWNPLIDFIENKLLKKFRDARDTLGRIWEQIKETAASVWDSIVGAIRDAVNLAIRIINKIGDAIETVAGYIGINIEIPDIPEIREARRRVGPPAQTSGGSRGQGPGARAALMAAGGVVPTIDIAQSGPFVTSAPRAIVGEGSSRHPEFVIPTDPKFRGRALDLFAQLGTQLMARGGIAQPKGPGIAGLYDPLAAAVQQIVNRARGAVTISSGWRSYDQQVRLYNLYRQGRGNLAARPGTSKHEAGAAVDFGGSRATYTRLAREAGLVAPVRGEPWHWEHPAQGSGGGGGGFLSGAVSWAVNKISNAAQGLIGLGEKVGGLPKKALEWLRDKAIAWATEKVQDVLFAPFRFATAPIRWAVGLTRGGPQWANRVIGEHLARDKYGWTGMQWSALDQLVMSESGWDHRAQNPNSTAFGIGQFLDSTWRTVGMQKTSDPALQIVAMLRYIAQRYGDPIRAWSFKQRNNWYEQGGVLPPFLGSFDTGLDRVPHDGLAFLHRNEAVLDPADAAMWRAAAEGSMKSGRSFQQTNQFYGITDYDEIARRTGEELAWQVTVGSH